MKKLYTLTLLFAVIVFITNCKKSTVDPIIPTPTNPCLSKTIVVTGTTTTSTNATANNGTITATAAGSTGFTYSTNGTTFQATGNFTGLAVGNYTVTAKDADGCTGTQVFSINSAACPTITTMATPTTTVKCNPNTGTLTLSGAGGAAPYTYSVNGGAFQSATLFSTLGSGTITYVVKDANGCTASGSSTIAFAPAGPGFTAVKNILNTYCTSCHGGSSPQNGINYLDDCTIVAQSARIKARAVDSNPSPMPLSGPGATAAERAAINAWVAAGGKYNN